MKLTIPWASGHFSSAWVVSQAFPFTPKPKKTPELWASKNSNPNPCIYPTDPHPLLESPLRLISSSPCWGQNDSSLQTCRNNYFTNSYCVDLSLIQHLGLLKEPLLRPFPEGGTEYKATLKDHILFPWEEKGLAYIVTMCIKSNLWSQNEDRITKLPQNPAFFRHCHFSKREPQNQVPGSACSESGVATFVFLSLWEVPNGTDSPFLCKIVTDSPPIPTPSSTCSVSHKSQFPQRSLSSILLFLPQELKSLSRKKV